MADFLPASQREWSPGVWVFSILLLDRSTSMIKYGAAPLNAVNRHITSLQQINDGRHYACSVVSFSNHAHVEIPLTPVIDLVAMHDYPACRGTLLWQTANETIERLLKIQSTWRLEAPPRIVIGIITDGDDNLSNEVYQSRLHASAKKAQELGWELLTLGIGIDGPRLALRMGFPTDPNHAYTLVAEAEGLRQSGIIMTDRTSGFYKKQAE